MSGTAGSPAVAAPKAALWERFDLKWVVVGVSVAVVSYLAVVPLVFLLWQSFFTPQTAAKAAEFTLNNYIQAYTSLETLRLFINSVQFGAGASLFAFFVGTLLAWMNERTGSPNSRTKCENSAALPASTFRITSVISSLFIIVNRPLFGKSYGFSENWKRFACGVSKPPPPPGRMIDGVFLRFTAPVPG